MFLLSTKVVIHLKKVLSMNLIAKYVATEYFRTVCASKKELLGGDRVPYLDTVFDMMERTYRSIGIPVSNPNTMLQKYPVWWLYFHNEVPVAFAVFKSTPYGLKAGLSGHDGSSEGKAAAVRTIRTKFKMEGVYGEVSHKVKDIALAAGAPKVPVEFVPEILGKPVEPSGDGFSYTRNISGVGRVEKILIGKPRGVKTATTTATVEEDEVADFHAHIACLALE